MSYPGGIVPAMARQAWEVPRWDEGRQRILNVDDRRFPREVANGCCVDDLGAATYADAPSRFTIRRPTVEAASPSSFAMR